MQIKLSKLTLFILLLMMALLTQSKKCKNNSPPPAPKPPPSATTEPKKLVIPIEPKEGGTITNPGNTKYEYPNLPGYNPFDSTCFFTKGNLANIKVTILYYDSSGNEVVYSDILYNNTNLMEDFGGFNPYINIQTPESGWYFIRTEYTMYYCNQCCGAFKTAGTGVPGCVPTQETLYQYQGKPRIKGETVFKEHFSGDELGGWDFIDFKMECICNCF